MYIYSVAHLNTCIVVGLYTFGFLYFLAEQRPEGVSAGGCIGGLVAFGNGALAHPAPIKMNL